MNSQEHSKKTFGWRFGFFTHLIADVTIHLIVQLKVGEHTQYNNGLSGSSKVLRGLISHRFISIFRVANTSNVRAYGIYDYKQVYKRIS
jgi:hypothetical protein